MKNDVADIEKALDWKKILKQPLIIWGIMLATALIAAYLKFVPFTYEVPKQIELFFIILIVLAIFLIVFAVGLDLYLFRKSRMTELLERSPGELKKTIHITTVIGTAFAQVTAYWGTMAVLSSNEFLYPMLFYIASLLLFAYFYPWKWRVFKMLEEM